MPRQACKTWEPELGRPGRPGRTPRSAGPGAGGTHLSGSAAQSDLLPTFAQPAQPAHALVVLAPPEPDPDLLSLFPPAALPVPACLPVASAAQSCCPLPLPVPVPVPVPVPAPAPAKLAISKRTDDVLSDLPHHPQNSILWPPRIHTYTRTRTPHPPSTTTATSPLAACLLQTSQARTHNTLRQTRPPPWTPSPALDTVQSTPGPLTTA